MYDTKQLKASVGGDGDGDDGSNERVTVVTNFGWFVFCSIYPSLSLSWLVKADDDDCDPDDKSEETEVFRV